jgi:transposase-like protein
MEQPIQTLQQAIQYFTDPENCRQFTVFVRWPDGVVRCPYCGATKLTWLAKAKVYQCYGDHPKKKFSLKVGTVFEDSPIGLDKWWPAVWLLSNCKNGISSYELHRALGVTQKTAWFMLHRIRLAMESNSFVKLGGSGGPVEIDETWVGGEPKNRHLSERDKLPAEPKYIIDDKGFRGRNPKYITPKGKYGRVTDKVPVFGALDRETRQIRTKVLPQVNREQLMNAILSNIEKGSTIHSDGLMEYRNLKDEGFVHEFVNHMVEYVRGNVHINGTENFWSLFKRTLKGTYVAVEPFHLGSYAVEQEFRYNNRATKDNPLTDADRFTLAASQISGKRLTYAELTGKVGETSEF